MPDKTLHEQLDRLEKRFEELAELCIRLRTENANLKAQQGDLMAERSRLVEKNEMARSKVEQMIMQLKSLETSP